MGIRNNARQIIVLNKDESEDHKSLIERRGKNKKAIEHYKTATFRYPSPREIQSLQTISHTWGTGDRYSKLAHEHYNEADLWWVIAWYNKRPTDAHLSAGDVVHIPFPIERVLSMIGV